MEHACVVEAWAWRAIAGMERHGRAATGATPRVWMTVTKGVGWMPRSFVPMKDVA